MYLPYRTIYQIKSLLYKKRNDIFMTVSEFINECNNFKYSKEYFDLYKE